MTDPISASLEHRRFRAGRAFELVVFDRLSPEEQVLLHELRADPELFGLLRPRPDSGRTMRAVNRGTALLWLTLQTEGPLPFFVWEGDAEAARRGIADLVLDGVLEVEDQGQFVCGAAALRLFEAGPPTARGGRLAQLTRTALRYAETLPFADAGTLAGRLYAYGRLPVTPAWDARTPHPSATLDFLGAGVNTATGRRLAAQWTHQEPSAASAWIAWSRSSRRTFRSGTGIHKLYVSPLPEALPHVFATLVDVLSGHGDVQFKIGGDASGLLRPDKLVAYLPDLDSLQDVAARLGERLAGAPAHGVPFTAAITPDGLLSWGMDPPPSERMLAWQDPESWRLWVVRRVAALMVAGRTEAGADVPSWEFALARLRRDGVDVDSWTPNAALWRAA
ncbi:MAG: hypothetical protein ACOY71_06125 [Gemmatimonadota bacterium]